MPYVPDRPAPPTSQPEPAALAIWMQRVLSDRFDSTLSEPVPEEMRRLLELH